MTREGHATVINRADYSAPAFWIDTVDLSFDLDPVKTRVLNRMTLRRNPDVAAQSLKLDGEELNLARVLVNGQGTSFKLEGNKLVLENLPEGTEPFQLEIFTTCAPVKNTSLSGLYVSQDSFFTQCEAEGFRRITYFLDQPGNRATFDVTLVGDPDRYPVMLSNGDLLGSGTHADGRGWVRFVDPISKPSYLFAVAAGVLSTVTANHTTLTGRNIELRVVAPPAQIDGAAFALRTMTQAMAYDEANGGIEHDLDVLSFVAIPGYPDATEYHGLMFFDSSILVADTRGQALLVFGSGAVRGFAVVHCLGIMTSIFSAVFFSRGIVNLWYGRQKKLGKVSIGQVWKPT